MKSSKAGKRFILPARVPRKALAPGLAFLMLLQGRGLNRFQKVGVQLLQEVQHQNVGERNRKTNKLTNILSNIILTDWAASPLSDKPPTKARSTPAPP